MQYFKISIKVILLALVTLTLASCKKDPIENPAVSALSFVNAAAGAPDLRVFIGQNQANNDIFNFGKNIGYLNAYSGEREVSFFQGSEKKATGKFNLRDGRFYSLFLAGKWPETELVLLQDSLTRPAANKAHIRFVNMSKDAGLLNLGLTNGSTLVSEKAYKAASDYIEVNGNAAYTFVIRNHAALTDTVSIPAVNLEAGHSYTIWAKGLKTEVGNDALGVAVIKNY
ncbi:DUF4397 domain-containing protein [Pedobacter insulae]|uniref:DUF4397 domain-containing protein n=1 Tax=Pedobacter insulae TaxID=414048 RepID=A0A1I2Y1G2_9SPHI|nr:DUF4397 domain-containing protein [Pedobacter insulae]SFH19608.1 protein of unknown function [Pedobacter insulae]